MLRALTPLQPLEFSAELVLEPEDPTLIITKDLSEQEKMAINKKKEASYKLRLKNLKEKISRNFEKIEALTHTTNENIEDSILMQILSNFNNEKINSKVKRPFDIIFGETFRFVGVSMAGKKKLTGNIIFAC